jgi:hypothetical protein
LLWGGKVAGADLEHECILITLPFTPKADINDGALVVVNASAPTSISPALVVVAQCFDAQDTEHEDAKAQLRQKFEKKEGLFSRFA